MAVPNSLSVVIPTLNEADALPALLDDLDRQRGLALRVIVADGGSDDATVALAAAGGAEVIEAVRGRGTQMNAGRGRVGDGRLLFLHADSRLPDGDVLLAAVAAWDDACRDAGHRRIAGHFGLRFHHGQPDNDRVYAYLEAKTRTGRPYTINGDQGLLIDGAYFDCLGGFDTRLPYLEDQRIAAAIDESGQWLLLPGDLYTSARRFETEGLMPRLQLMALMMVAHAAGLEAFFITAPALYRSQDQAAALRVEPFLRLFNDMMAALPATERRTAWRRIGRFVRDNAWQAALLRDARRGRLTEPRSLHRFERLIEPRLDGAIAAGVFTALSRLAIGQLWPWLARRNQPA